VRGEGPTARAATRCPPPKYSGSRGRESESHSQERWTPTWTQGRGLSNRPAARGGAGAHGRAGTEGARNTGRGAGSLYVHGRAKSYQ